MFQPSTPNSQPVALQPGTHYVIKDGVIVDQFPAGTPQSNPSTLYVTVQSENLPLTRPLRLIPGGDILANAVDPLMTDLVNAGYNDGLGIDGNPAIPEDPTVPRPMKPFSSLSALGADDVQEDVEDGATAGATTAFDNIGNPANLITKPLGEAGKLPFLSTLTNSSVSANNLTSAKSAAPEAKSATTGSNTERPKPLKKISDDFNSSLKKFADAVNPKKPTASENDDSE
jgi:hypothetical protein